MADWKEIPFTAKLLTNLDEAALRNGAAAVENAFANEQGGYTGFPGLKPFCTLAGQADTFLCEWRGDAIAVSNSRMYRVRRDGTFDDVTGSPVRGSGRVYMDRSDDDLLAAAGAEIIRFSGDKTELLSPDAPLATRVGYIDQFTVGVEANSGRFFNSSPGAPREWDPVDVFLADSKPDNINALIITPYRELIFTGLDSTEQFERLPSGTTTFFRRWANGEGNIVPDSAVYADNAVWFINGLREWVRVSGQTSQSRGDPIGKSLENGVDKWDGAWATSMSLVGQKFILLQAPNATSPYGTRGITFAYDFRQDRWFNLYGWDEKNGLPARWPGCSYYYMKLWGKHLVGGKGCIYELDEDTFDNLGLPRRVLLRSAMFDGMGECAIKNLRIRVKRGLANSNDKPARIAVRMRRDNRLWSNWAWKDLGRAGEGAMMLEFGGFGQGEIWQSEIMVTDPCQVEIGKVEAYVQSLKRG